MERSDDQLGDDCLAAFLCVRGDADNVALTEEGCFAVQDAQGRNWICRELDRDSLLSESEATLTAIPDLQKTLQSLGYHDTGGTTVVVCVTRLPEPITREDQIGQLREFLGNAGDDDEGEEWKRGGSPK